MAAGTLTRLPDDSNVGLSFRSTGLKESHSYSTSEKSFLHDSRPADSSVILKRTRSWA